MRKNLQTLLRQSFTFLLIFYCTNSSLAAEIDSSNSKILFQSGTVITENNFTALKEQFIPPLDLVENRYYRIIQFEQLPSDEIKSQLLIEGVRLLNYLPQNAFFASISIGTDFSKLDKCGIRTILSLEPHQKSSRAIREKNIPNYAKSGDGLVSLIVLYFNDMSEEFVSGTFLGKDYEIIRSYHQGSQVRLRIASNRIPELLSIPFVKYFLKVLWLMIFFQSSKL